MPLYIDKHKNLKGVTAEDVAKAHEADLKAQEKYNVRYRSYWVDEKGGNVFCLVEAPTKEAAIAVHREAHGLLADELIEVLEGA